MNGLFAYGTLKKNEIAFSQIKDMVDKVIPVDLNNHEIGIRDSLPVIFQSTNSKVQGELIMPKKDLEKIFWETIDKYEGTKLYLKSLVTVNLGGESIDCTTYLAKKEKGSGYVKLEYSSWSSKHNPYFAYSFPILYRSIKKIEKKSQPADMYLEYWTYMNELQEKYLLLTGILENIALLVIGHSNDIGPIQRIMQLGQSKEWKRAFDSVKNNSGIREMMIKDARNLKDTYRNNSPDKAILMYYQIRNNLSHQGKSGFEDCELIFNSLQILSEIIKQYLLIKIEDINEVWNLLLRSD